MVAPISYWQQVFDHAGVTPDVQAWVYEGSGTPEQPYAVIWIENDPRNPMLYSFWTKWGIAALMGLETLGVTFCSSVYTGGVSQIMIEFGCSREVVILGLSFFVLGFAVGPLVWAPLSEMYGRQFTHIASFFGLTAFNAGAAASQNVYTLIILRFLAGSVGSSALVSSGAVLADIFSSRDRGLAGAIYSMAPWLGPVLGPIIGGFVGETIGWRWLQGIMAIFTAVIWIAGSVLVPETYAPVLLRRRAAELSKLSGKVYRSRDDIERAGSEPSTLRKVLKTNLVRPWLFLFTEPIVLALGVYVAIVYGTLYMFFGAYPIGTPHTSKGIWLEADRGAVYQQERGWSQGIGGLAFLGVLVGMILAVIPCSVLIQQQYAKISNRLNGIVPPEARLPACMIGAVAAPVGLFWFAWTNSPSIHFMVSISAGGLFGFGLVLIFGGSINYIIDSYTIYAASALAANSLLRSIFGAVFPLFTSQMFESLGIHWASTVPAFLALACLPFPFLLHNYGPVIRRRCKFAAESATFIQRIQGPQIPLNSESLAYVEEDEKEKELV